MEIRVRVPQVPAGLGANLLGLAGLIAVAVAVGGLTGNWWWTLLVGGAFAFGLSWIAQNQAPGQNVAAAQTAPVPVADLARAAMDEQTAEIAYMRGRPPATVTG